MNQPEVKDAVEQLLELSASGPRVLADLDNCVHRLREVQAAKSTLAQLSTEDVRQAIARRHQRLVNPGGGS
jgi:thioredoxin-like negative regulator of GroEL